MTILLRLFIPALALGAALLLGERPSCPPDEIPAAEMSAATCDDFCRAQSRPVLASGGAETVLPVRRLPAEAAERPTAAAAPPETRSLSPPLAA